MGQLYTYINTYLSNYLLQHLAEFVHPDLVLGSDSQCLHTPLTQLYLFWPTQ
jgi:hypothetical protein